MKREFSPTNVSIDSSHRLRGYRIVCGECGASERITCNNHAGGLPQDAIRQKFRNKGWGIGSKDGQDLCPSCQAQRTRKAKIVKEEGSNIIVIATNEPETISDQPSREATREEKRIVFARINDVYADETTGYKTGWSDAAVAADLGVPVDWVSAVREEHFGIEGGGEKALESLEEAMDLIASAKELQTALDAVIEAEMKRVAARDKANADARKAHRSAINTMLAAETKRIEARDKAEDEARDKFEAEIKAYIEEERQRMAAQDEADAAADAAFKKAMQEFLVQQKDLADSVARLEPRVAEALNVFSKQA